MRRLRIEICTIDGAVVDASCVEGIAPLKGMWQVWRTGAVPLPEVQAAVLLTLSQIPNHKPIKEVPTDRIRRRAKARHG